MSDYVIPSSIWIEEVSEKKKLIEKYHENMKQKECKYTKMGRVDDCPFGNKCFYRHQMSDGSVTRGESPRELQRRRKFLDNIHQEFLDLPGEEDSIMNDVIERIVININNRNRVGGSDDS